MRYISLSLILASSLFAEPSAFGAGAMDSDNPYGLTESERSIVENRKVSLSNQKLIRKQAIIIEQLQEKIEGLSTVIDSISSKIGQTGEKINEISSQSKRAGEQDIENLQAQIDDLKRSSDENYAKINSSLKKLTKLMGGSTSSKTSKKKVDKKIKPTPKEKPISNGELLKKAISAYRAKNYTKAEEAFTKLASKSYKPAKTNYYLGEIAYYTKKYEDAISFYKTSVGYYDQASYMPTLLLHTALSFKNIGDIENADRFFNTILSTYPNSPEASIAQTNIN
jgi:TolA-binding protein